MTRNKFLIGISAVALSTAFGAGSAAAQTSNSSSVSGCGTGTGNTCTVNNNAAGNDRNQSSISVSGTGNAVTVDQVGDDNRSFVTIAGNTNTVDHDQVADENFASTNINGSENRSEIEQRDENNSATVSITGNRNTGSVTQGGFPSGAEPATANAGGQNNSATVLLRGNNLLGVVQQGTFAGGASAGDNTATLDLSSGAAASTAGSQTQQADVEQLTRGNTARVTIRGGAAGAPGSGLNTGTNSASVTQENTQFQAGSGGTFTSGAPTTASNTPIAGNIADVSISGFGNSVLFAQNGVQNNRGGATPAGPRGTSTAGESTGADTIDVAGGGTTTTASGGGDFEGLTFAGDRRAGNEVDIFQTGRDNRVRVSVGPIGNSSDERAQGSGRGNDLLIIQTGAGGAGNEGRAHFAQVFQQAQLSQIQVVQSTNTAGSAVSTSNPTGAQFGSVVRIGQSDFASTLSITQEGTNRADLAQGGRGSGSGATGRTGNNVQQITQIDAGDAAGSTSSDPFGGTSTTPGAQQFNEVLTSQSGRFNSMTISQNGRSAYALGFQRNGANSSTLEINQGGGNGGGGFGSGTDALATGGVSGSAAGESFNTSATVNQGGSGITRVRQDGTNLTVTVNQNNLNDATVTATAGNRATVGVSQVGNNNSATVTQAGEGLTVDSNGNVTGTATSGSLFHSATVDQRSNNTSSSLVNRVTIAQVGLANATNRNIAIARQTNANAVSPSTSGSTTISAEEGGGTRSGANPSEIRIIQRLQTSGTNAGTTDGNNSATVEQQGQGQLGIIEQSGRNNEAGILQGVNATNAVAVIRQTGSGNVFFIEQTQPNQFFRVTQSGGTNTITGSGDPNFAGGTPGGTGTTGTGGPGTVVAPAFTGGPTAP